MTTKKDTMPEEIIARFNPDGRPFSHTWSGWGDALGVKYIRHDVVSSATQALHIERVQDNYTLADIVQAKDAEIVDEVCLSDDPPPECVLITPEELNEIETAGGE